MDIAISYFWKVLLVNCFISKVFVNVIALNITGIRIEGLLRSYFIIINWKYRLLMSKLITSPFRGGQTSQTKANSCHKSLPPSYFSHPWVGHEITCSLPTRRWHSTQIGPTLQLCVCMCVCVCELYTKIGNRKRWLPNINILKEKKHYPIQFCTQVLSYSYSMNWLIVEKQKECRTFLIGILLVSVLAHWPVFWL